MRYLWKGLAIVAIWGLVAAFAFSGEKWVTGNLIIGMAIIAFFGTYAVANAGFSKCKCGHCAHGDDEDE